MPALFRRRAPSRHAEYFTRYATTRLSERHRHEAPPERATAAAITPPLTPDLIEIFSSRGHRLAEPRRARHVIFTASHAAAAEIIAISGPEFCRRLFCLPFHVILAEPPATPMNAAPCRLHTHSYRSRHEPHEFLMSSHASLLCERDIASIIRQTRRRHAMLKSPSYGLMSPSFRFSTRHQWRGEPSRRASSPIIRRPADADAARRMPRGREQQ